MPRNTSALVADELDEMFETEQLAEQLHISPRTVEGWRNRGLGPTFVKAGHRVLYRKSAIVRWLHQQTKSHTRA